MQRKPLSIFSMLVVLFVSSVAAEEGRIPIFEKTVLDGSLGNITGKYVVTRNIDVATDEPAIRVVGTGVERVEIDLNGFELRSARTGVAPEAGAVIEASNLASFRLSNGSVLTTTAVGSQGNGVSVLDTGEAIVEDVSVADAFIGIEVRRMELFAVRRCFVNRTDSTGIHAESGAGQFSLGNIEDNLLTNVDSISMNADGMEGLTIARNKIYSGNNGVIVSDTTSCFIEDNTIENTLVTYALRVQDARGCTISGNVLRNSQGQGLVLAGGSGHIIADNVIVDGQKMGIQAVGVSGRHIIERNLISSNGGDGTSPGISIDSDRNVVRNNSVTDNGGYGIVLLTNADGNTLDGNSSQGNLGSAAACANPIGACTAPDYCDDSTGGTNKTFGTNLMPDGC